MTQEEATKPQHHEQGFKQQTSVQFNTYAEAKAVLKTYGKGRYRIRARPSGHYDLITYQPV